MFPLSACQTLLIGLWLFDYRMSCKRYDSYKHQGLALTFASLPLHHKYNPRKGCEKIIFMREMRVESTSTKSMS